MNPAFFLLKNSLFFVIITCSQRFSLNGETYGLHKKLKPHKKERGKRRVIVMFKPTTILGNLKAQIESLYDLTLEDNKLYIELEDLTESSVFYEKKEDGKVWMCSTDSGQKIIETDWRMFKVRREIYDVEGVGVSEGSLKIILYPDYPGMDPEIIEGHDPDLKVVWDDED
jgi:hypothetical protein